MLNIKKQQLPISRRKLRLCVSGPKLESFYIDLQWTLLYHTLIIKLTQYFRPYIPGLGLLIVNQTQILQQCTQAELWPAKTSCYRTSRWSLSDDYPVEESNVYSSKSGTNKSGPSEFHLLTCMKGFHTQSVSRWQGLLNTRWRVCVGLPSPPPPPPPTSIRLLQHHRSICTHIEPKSHWNALERI